MSEEKRAMFIRDNREQSISQRLSASLIIATVVLFAYSVVLSNKYGVMDDYIFLRNAIFGTKDVFFALISSGRPLNGVLLDLGFRLTGSIDNLVGLRAVTLFGIWLLGYGIYFFSRLHCVSFISSLAIACGILLLPSFQVYASWAQHCTTPFAGAIALLSAFILTPVCTIRERSRVVAVLLSALLLLSSLLIYQPIGMFFCVGILISIISKPKIRSDWKPDRMIDAAAAFISAMLFGLLIFKIGQHIFPGELDRFGLVQNIYNKFVWFLSEPIANALSLYAVPSNTVLQFSVILILIVGSLFFIRAHGPVDGALMIFLAATCVLCSYSPNLATAENWASYRSIGALSASVVALVVFMVSEIYSYYERKYSSISLVKKFNKYKWVASAILLIILATYVQGNVLNGFVLPNVTELNNLVSFLSEAKGQGSKKVALTIKPSSWSDSASGKMAYDEFGLHSSITDCYAKAIVEIVLHSTNLIPDAIIVPSEGVITDQQSDHYTNIVVDFSHLITSQRFKTSSPKHSVIGLLQKNNIIASANSLSFYSAKGDLATVKLLINAGIDVNAQTSGGSYALIEASWAGKQDVVSYLLDAKADVNSASNQITPLSAAIIQKHELIALLLLEHGANPNVVDSIGSTPLMECSWQGNVLLVNALLSKGASPNYRRSSDGMTATKFALAAKKEDVVKILKAAGASE